MRKLTVITLLLCCTLAFAKDDPTASALARLRTAAKCEDKASPWRPWCIAADWSKGTAELPKGTLVGLTIQLEDGADAKQALSDRVSFVALAVGKDGKVKLTDIKPTAKGEDVMIAEVVMSAAAVFKGKAKTAQVPKDLAGYIKGLQGTYKAEKNAIEWTWQGQSAAKLRKVGAFWVVIETPAKGNGIFATILTDAWEAKP
jgi:hypothetical protein